MAVLVSHAMHRFPSSPPDAVHTSYGLRGAGNYRQETDTTDRAATSSGGALSRSMRYAEPWLYGSVRASGGLFLAPALVLCQCPEYLTGSKRSNSSKKSPHVCKKCNGTRLPLSPLDSKFGTVRCYPTSQQIVPSTPLRAGTVRVTSSSSRPSILPTADPYDLMRRSRLSVPETHSTISPFRDKTSTSSGKRETNQKIQSKCVSYESTLGRKSILECDINPYELMCNDKLVAPKEAVKTKQVTLLVGGQRVRMQPTTKNHQHYEDVQVPKNGKSSTKGLITPSKLPRKTPQRSPMKLVSMSEKEYENGILTTNPFKSILKKRGSNYSSDCSPYSDVEEPSNLSGNGSKFYVPMQISLTPRKKVQFLDTGKDKSSNEKHIEIPKHEAAYVIEDDSERQLCPNKDTVYEDVATHVEIKNEKVENKDILVNVTKKPVKIIRSNSDCTNNEHKNIDFLDTMALRSRKRSDSRILFSEQDLAKLDGITARTRKISPLKPRPNIPPPPPPPSNANNQLSDDMQSSECLDNKSLCESDDKPKVESPPSVPPRKRSNGKQPTMVTWPEISTSSINTETLTSNKTVVQISSPTPVHKIKIKNEFPDYTDRSETQNISIFENPQRKTSILINGDDCYSTVINDNVPLYQSSVVVNDETPTIQVTTSKNSSKIYISGSFGPNHRVEPATSSDTSENSKDPAIASNKFNSTCSAADFLKEILRDPVEAVRHNLVPHVCGKSDMARRQRDLKFPKHNLPLGKAESLLESPLEEVNIPTSVEDSFLRLRNYESIDDDYDVDEKHSEDGDSSQYELMDQASECYTDHSNRSSVTEEELANRTKFYELLAESGNIEVAEGDDHHYESIKINNDPIYEEIELPPPLPANPPPSMILDDLQLDKEYTTRSIFEGASKYDILSYLVDAKERGIAQEEGYIYPFSSSKNQEDDTKESYNRISNLSTVSDSSEDNSLIISGALIDEKATYQKPAEVERNDSGVGSETSKSSLSRYRTKPEIFVSCEDCDSSLESKTENEPLLCRKCIKKRSERKEIIMEIVETEEKYSRDLQIILEEFYQPMLVAGLLTPDQLSAIFLNVEELLENSQALAERLRDAVEIASEQGDEDLLTVNIGKPFLESTPMLHAFETYCVRQGTASLLLAGLEKEKELLRIFLRVSQMENTMLRRMNLNSFLMVPVQRVTKYPLLLARLYKVTPMHHETKEQLKEAQHKIELHLNHMNSETKDVPSKLWRRIGSNAGRRPSTEMDLVNIKLRKIAVDVLEWNHEEARFILEGKLLFTQPTDNNWRKGRTIKLTPVNALLVINGKTPGTNKSSNEKIDDNSLVFSTRTSGVREAALLLIRDKNGRYSLLREPLYLDRCVIAADPAWQSYFEVQELLNKDTFIFKAEDEDQTQGWYRKLQFHAQGMGAWRKRRNALANIMINGMGLRS
ncbi:hypothetical protein ABEB36_001681 [Hypothenemus hampei]|uniref:DH domain-containing protein n=1 Tax=Hypothenemus hampei TaxID=57062 RepID=A0ABD1FIJ7_HYPHA